MAEHGNTVNGIYTTGTRIGKSPEYTPWHKGLKKLYSEGTMTRGVGASTIRGAFFGAGNQLGYDGSKTFAKNNGISDGPALHAFASVCGAVGASTFSNPAGVIMTRYQSGPSLGIHYKN